MGRNFLFNGDEMPEDLFSDEEEDSDADEESIQSINLGHRELNSVILFKTIKMLKESDPKWANKTLSSKLKSIDQAYFHLLALSHGFPDA